METADESTLRITRPAQRVRGWAELVATSPTSAAAEDLAQALDDLRVDRD